MTKNSEAMVKHEDITELVTPDRTAQFKASNLHFKAALKDTAPSFQRMWEELEGFVDTNAMILFNIKQVQLLLQGAQSDFYERKAKFDAILDKIAEHGEKADNVYIAMQANTKKELDDVRKHILQLSTAVTGMAREYRQCAMQKKFVVHLVQVQQLIMLVQEIVKRHVKDRDVLNQISKEILEANARVFTDIGDDS